MSDWLLAGIIVFSYLEGIYMGWLLWRKPTLGYPGERR